MLRFRAGKGEDRFFVVNPGAAIIGNQGEEDSCAIECMAEAKVAIGDALREFCADGSLVAVRSSSVEEDDAENSFAGQLDSFLNLPIKSFFV